jgi:hypothetical protein
MFTAILVYAVCTGLEPNSMVSDARADCQAIAAYHEARARAGRDADAQVQLALWCEANGMPAERLKHLAIAVMKDPAHDTARGLIGLVKFQGQWQTPDAVSARVQSDEEYSRALARYSSRRTGMADTADAHWKLAMWCKHQGLNP